MFCCSAFGWVGILLVDLIGIVDLGVLVVGLLGGWLFYVVGCAMVVVAFGYYYCWLFGRWWLVGLLVVL